MLKHHEVAFQAFIDQVVRTGAASTTWESLYSWFNTTRISKTVWRQIHAQYLELCDYYDWQGDTPALSALTFDASVTLIRGPFEREKLSVLSEEGIG
ncbi:hypothetical protein [Stenotrophomonas forensis]|uniref:Uncharacterized protein n=1 Tax=Stenotrophomonas forensis TaxID=2871169 RepID=A0ABY7Y5R9_9GAMM|nr:hypothetical protein [Stenotrophomonas sp. DFS-20110405]WDM65319.1 hypothetical protein K5L94_08615 [Stenotrophomonas sp. DFS-20110405]